MGIPTYFVSFTGTAYTGHGYTPDGTLPAGAVACSQADAQASGPWSTLVNGALVVGTAPAPTPAEVAASAYSAFIAAGVSVTSTGTPALDGLFPVDAQSQADIATEAQFISTFSEFTNGGTVNLTWFLANGSAVTFPTTAEFMALAKGIGQAVAAAKLALGQGSTVMPSPTIAIP